MIYFDLDNTLIDYNSSERKAIEFIFKEKYGLVLNNNQTDYWSKISRKYFDYYLSKQITFEEQGKNRFIKMLSYCGYVENEKIAMELFEEYQKQLENYKINLPEIEIKKRKSVWGTCIPSKNKVIFNFNIIKTPIDCVEYVVLHELSHFKYPNHSKDFYNFIAIFMPNWKERRRILNKEFSKII